MAIPVYGDLSAVDAVCVDPPSYLLGVLLGVDGAEAVGGSNYDRLLDTRSCLIIITTQCWFLSPSLF